MIKVSRILCANLPDDGWILPGGKVISSQMGDGGHAGIAMRYLGISKNDPDDYIEDGCYEKLYEMGWIRFYLGSHILFFSTSVSNLTQTNIHMLQSLAGNEHVRQVYLDIDLWKDGNEVPVEALHLTMEEFMCANNLRDLRHPRVEAAV